MLHMLRIGHVQRSCDPLAHGLVDIQELSKTHEAISKAKTELWHPLPGRRLLAIAERGLLTH